MKTAKKNDVNTNDAPVDQVNDTPVDTVIPPVDDTVPGNTIENPPAKPVVGVVIKGDVSAIPEALLNRGSNAYNWGDMGVGDHKLIAKADAVTARASAYAFGRSKGRKFGSMKHKADTNFIEMWRLPDPKVETVATVETQSETTETENEADKVF